MVDLTDLRRANVARDREWTKGVDMGVAFHTIELGGEGGELQEAVIDILAQNVDLGSKIGGLLNKVKKVIREDAGLPGSRVTAEELDREFGDVQICLDLLAMKMGRDLNRCVCKAFNEKSEELGFKTRL